MLDLLIKPLEPCRISTTCPRCAHIDQAVGLCSHIVFYHFSPWAPLLSLNPPPAQHCPAWPCGCFCPKWRFHNHEQKPGECSGLWVSCLVVIVVVYTHKNTDNVEDLTLLQMDFITLCLCSTESSWSLPSLSHTLKTPLYTKLIIFFCCITVVHYSLPSSPCIYEDLGGCSVEAVLFLACACPRTGCLSPYNLIDRVHQE